MGRIQGRDGPRVRRSVAEIHDLDEDVVPGNVEPDVIAEGVRVVIGEAGASFWPVTFDRLPAETRELAQLVGEWVAMRRDLRRRIDATVPELREGGMSWGQIGFLVGISDEGARQRWGEKTPTE